MKKVSKIFFLTAFIFCYIISVVSSFRLASSQTDQPVIFLVMTVGALLFASYIWFSLWFKAWGSIQDGKARATPGKAVLFSFIPFFNLYWIFQLIWGFAQDYNSYIQRHQIFTKRLPSRLFLFYVFLLLVNIFFALRCFCSSWRSVFLREWKCRFSLF